MTLGISQHKLLIAVVVQSETPALSTAAHSKSIWNKKSSGTYQPIMSDPAIHTLISKWHVIWWVRPILWYSQPLPSNWSMFFLRLPWLSLLPIFFFLTSEGLATPGQPCRLASRTDPWHMAPTMWNTLIPITEAHTDLVLTYGLLDRKLDALHAPGLSTPIAQQIKATFLCSQVMLEGRFQVKRCTDLAAGERDCW